MSGSHQLHAAPLAHNLWLHALAGSSGSQCLANTGLLRLTISGSLSLHASFLAQVAHSVWLTPAPCTPSSSCGSRCLAHSGSMHPLWLLWLTVSGSLRLHAPLLAQVAHDVDPVPAPYHLAGVSHPVEQFPFLSLRQLFLLRSRLALATHFLHRRSALHLARLQHVVITSHSALIMHITSSGLGYSTQPPFRHGDHDHQVDHTRLYVYVYDWHYIIIINNYYSMTAKVYVMVAHITCYNGH